MEPIFVKIQTEKPFEDYSGSTWFNPRTGRWTITLWHRPTRTNRSMTYARYLVSVREGRRLLSTEHVDHVNNDKADDRLENLQILSAQANTRKRFTDLGITKAVVDLICPICKASFRRDAKQVGWKIKAGRIPSCGKRCGGIMSLRNGVNRKANGHFTSVNFG